MLRTRVIPCLLLRGGGLVKTVRFDSPTYVGDPINAVKIFNDKEVDELVLLDIKATPERRLPQVALIREIASECFMPLSYGGGITDVEQMREILKSGVEKVVLNTAAVRKPEIIEQAAREFGSSSVVVSIDARRKLFGRHEAYVDCGRKATGLEVTQWARQAQERGAGELFLNSIDQDGTQRGYDLELVRKVTCAVTIPVIACGGAGSVTDFSRAVKEAGASGVSAGSLFVFHGKHRAVLISYPTRDVLERTLP